MTVEVFPGGMAGLPVSRRRLCRRPELPSRDPLHTSYLDDTVARQYDRADK